MIEPIGEMLSELWAGPREAARTPEMIRADAEACDREGLRELGVDVDDPVALQRAYRDPEIMGNLARLQGRQMRERLEQARANGQTWSPVGFAAELKAARDALAGCPWRYA